MFKMQSMGLLSELLDKKNMTEEERKRILAISAALNMIAVAVANEQGSHRLSEEMDNLQKYTDKIMEVLK